MLKCLTVSRLGGRPLWGGKSGLRRAGRQLTAGEGDFKDSATEINRLLCR